MKVKILEYFEYSKTGDKIRNTEYDNEILEVVYFHSSDDLIVETQYGTVINLYEPSGDKWEVI